MTHPLPSAFQAAMNQADPLADETIAAIIGPWPADSDRLDASALARIGVVNRLFSTFGNNAQLAQWQAPTGTDPQIAQTLQTYVREGSQLPAWADRAKVERTEDIFIEDGPLSCLLLFCASLPECYVMPDLADVLHIAGQLEAHTERRIRHTAAMIFPVMMRGGLMGAQGNGLAQILKVRLIHATIRHLILRGPPQSFTRAIAPGKATAAPSMHEALMLHGWDPLHQGLPCNQIELAYTLLTFGYVFVKGRRTLRQELPPADEEAYLHTWNVMGHVLGIRSDLMANTMQDSEAIFAQLQAYARSKPPSPDVRPALGQALIQAMAASLKLPVLKFLPLPLTQLLVGQETAANIGLSKPASWVVRIVFFMLTGLIRIIDGIGRLFTQRFSISRLITRILGYHLITQLMMSETRPLALPAEVLDELNLTAANWGHDSKAFGWMNRLEDRFTRQGLWSVANHPSIREQQE